MQDIGWLLLAILTPLALNLWGQQPFELPKVLLMRTVVWLLWGLLLTEMIVTRRSWRQAFPRNPMWRPVALLAGVLIVTTITAVNPQLSFWGSIERNQGALTQLTYLLLFCLATIQLRPYPRAQRLIIAMSLTAIPIILFGLAQMAGWNPFALVTDARSPIYATLGRANFVGAYLAMLTPLTLALLLIAGQQKVRLFWSLLLVGELLVIGLTLTRSAWLATAVSLSLFSLLWWGQRLTRRWRWMAWSGLGLLFLAGPLAVLLWGQAQIGSTAARLAIWQGTVNLIGKRPFLGYGADSLGLIFPRIYPPELVYYQGRDFFVDRAHNLLLDWGVIAGIPGILAFLLVLFTFVILIRNALQHPQAPQKRVLLIATLAAVLGNTANNLVSFDVTPTAMVTWLLMGIGVAQTLPIIEEKMVGQKRPLTQYLLPLLLFIIIGVAIWQGNGRPLLADIAARSAQQYTQAGNWKNATIAAEKAVAYWPTEPSYHRLLSQTYWQQAVANPTDAPRWLPQAEAALQVAQQTRPNDLATWMQTAQFYSASQRQFGRPTSDLANEAYQQALTLAPNKATIYTAWGAASLADGDVQTAVSLLRQAVILDNSNGQAYIHLGAAELALGRGDIALADYQEAVRLLPTSSAAYSGLAHTFWQLGQIEAATLALEKALQYDPQNGQAIALQQTMLSPP